MSVSLSVAENVYALSVLGFEMWSECANLDFRCRTRFKLGLLAYKNLLVINLVNCHHLIGCMCVTITNHQYSASD